MTNLESHPHHHDHDDDYHHHRQHRKLSLSNASILTILIAIKFLLLPTYRSTDFDVHRNWLSVTRHLPLHQWYFDGDDYHDHDNHNFNDQEKHVSEKNKQQKRTVHTLDYPPLFALFEYGLSSNPLTSALLSQPSKSNGKTSGMATANPILHPRCLDLLPDDDNDVGYDCVAFQRCTVIFADGVFWFGAWLCVASLFRVCSNEVDEECDDECDDNDDKEQDQVTVREHDNAQQMKNRNNDNPNQTKQTIAFHLLACNPGLLLLDHVHFQYNGMLLGILLISLAFLIRGIQFHRPNQQEQQQQQQQRQQQQQQSRWNTGQIHNDLLGAAAYAALLTLKHLYLILAPLYFAYLLRHYCFTTAKTPNKNRYRRCQNQQCSIPLFLLLATVTLLTLVTPFVPFFLHLPPHHSTSTSTSTVVQHAKRQLQQMASRLFPFQRGLCHDYWAGNVWALYLFFEKICRFVVPRVTATAIEDVLFPEISPGFAAVCLLVGLLPGAVCAWHAAALDIGGDCDDTSTVRTKYDSFQSCPEHNIRTSNNNDSNNDSNNNNNNNNKIISKTKIPKPRTSTTTSIPILLIECLTFSSLSGFLLAYHVHEKAIMTAIVPATLLSVTSKQHARLFLRLAAVGHFGLLPLLFRPVELAFKVLICVAFLALAVFYLDGLFVVSMVNAGVTDGVRSSRCGGDSLDDECAVKERSMSIPSKRKRKQIDDDDDDKESTTIPVWDDGELVTIWDKVGMIVMASILVFAEVVHPLVFQPHNRMEFLPLLMISVFCAVGIVACWIQCGWLMFRSVRELRVARSVTR